MSEKGPNLLSQGSYGCVFRPGIKCDGKKVLKKKFITKIQKYKDTSKKETTLGKKIKKIKNYEDYFAPVLSSCNISLGKINNKEIERCEFLDENENVSYESNKMRYVGKNTLSKEILKISQSNPKRLIRVIIDIHKTLLEGYKKLFDAGIIHLDVKENNIICEDTTGNPIIIDFGLSAEISKLSEDNYKEVFFTYEPSYMPWCIDICMITYLANKLENELAPPGMLGFVGFTESTLESWEEGIITKDKLNIVINDYTKKNTGLLDLFKESECLEYNKKLQSYFDSFIGKKWKVLLEELLKYNSTWDSYAVSIMILHILKNIESDKMENKSIIVNYIEYLKSSILSLPNERPTNLEIIEKLNTLFNKISYKDSVILSKSLDVLSSDSEKNKVKTRILKTINNNLSREIEIYNKLK